MRTTTLTPAQTITGISLLLRSVNEKDSMPVELHDTEGEMKSVAIEVITDGNIEQCRELCNELMVFQN